MGRGGRERGVGVDFKIKYWELCEKYQWAETNPITSKRLDYFFTNEHFSKKIIGQWSFFEVS